MDTVQKFNMKDVPGIVIGVFDLSGIDLVGTVVVDLYEYFIMETDGDIDTEVKGVFEYGVFVVSITGVSFLYLLCCLTVDKIKAFSVELILTFVAEVVLSIVIDVVGTTLIDLIRGFPLDSDVMFPKAFAVDADWWIFVDTFKGFVGNENGALVVYRVVGISFGVYWTYADWVILADLFDDIAVNVVEPSVFDAFGGIAMNVNKASVIFIISNFLIAVIGILASNFAVAFDIYAVRGGVLFILIFWTQWPISYRIFLESIILWNN